MKFSREVFTVEDDRGVVLGFATQRVVLYGVAQGVDDAWYVTRDLLKPHWVRAGGGHHAIIATLQSMNDAEHKATTH